MALSTHSAAAVKCCLSRVANACIREVRVVSLAPYSVISCVLSQNLMVDMLYNQISMA